MKKFPLDPLVELRAHAVGERREDLRERLEQVQDARHAADFAEQRQRAYDAERRGVEATERVRLSRGDATIEDFLLLAQYQVGAAKTAARLLEQCAVVQQRLERAERAQSEALQSLTEARAQQREIDNQKVRFVATERAAVEAAAEDEALEAWGSRRH